MARNTETSSRANLERTIPWRERRAAKWRPAPPGAQTLCPRGPGADTVYRAAGTRQRCNIVSLLVPPPSATVAAAAAAAEKPREPPPGSMAPSAAALVWLLILFPGNSEASPLPPGAGIIPQRCQITAGEKCHVRLNSTYFDIFDENNISQGYCSNGLLTVNMPGFSQDSKQPPDPTGCNLTLSKEAAGTYMIRDINGIVLSILIVEVLNPTFGPDRPVNGTSNSTDRAVINPTFGPDRPVNGTSNSTDQAGGLERAHPHWGSIAAAIFVPGIIVLITFIGWMAHFKGIFADCLRRDRDPPGGAPDNIPMEQRSLSNGHAPLNCMPAEEDEGILHRSSSDPKRDSLQQCSKDTNYRAECNHLVVVYPNSHALNKSAVPTLPPANMLRAWKGRSLDIGNILPRHTVVLTGISCTMTAFRYRVILICDIETILLMKISLKEAIAKEIGTLTLKAVAPTEQAWAAQDPYSLWCIVRDRGRELRPLPDRGLAQNGLFSGGFGSLAKTPHHLLKAARERSITTFTAADAGAAPPKHRKGKTTVPSNAPVHLYREKQMSLFQRQLCPGFPPRGRSVRLICAWFHYLARELSLSLILIIIIMIGSDKSMVFMKSFNKKNRTKVYKYLGYHINYNMQWRTHAESMAPKAKLLTFELQFQKKYGGHPYLPIINLYKSKIQAVLLYGAEIWGHSEHSSLEKTEGIILRRLLSLPNGVPPSGIRSEFNLTSCVSIAEAARYMSFQYSLVNAIKENLAAIRMNINCSLFNNMRVTLNETITRCNMNPVWHTIDVKKKWKKNCKHRDYFAMKQLKSLSLYIIEATFKDKSCNEMCCKKGEIITICLARLHEVRQTSHTTAS